MLVAANMTRPLLEQPDEQRPHSQRQRGEDDEGAPSSTAFHLASTLSGALREGEALRAGPRAALETALEACSEVDAARRCSTEVPVLSSGPCNEDQPLCLVRLQAGVAPPLELDLLPVEIGPDEEEMNPDEAEIGPNEVEIGPDEAEVSDGLLNGLLSVAKAGGGGERSDKGCAEMPAVGSPCEDRRLSVRASDVHSTAVDGAVPITPRSETLFVAAPEAAIALARSGKVTEA